MSDSQIILIFLSLFTALGAPFIIWLVRPRRRIWVLIKSSQPVTIAPGIPAEVSVYVGRRRYSGKVNVSIDDLPKWLSAEPAEISFGCHHGQITLDVKGDVVPSCNKEVQVVAGAATLHASVPLQITLL